MWARLTASAVSTFKHDATSVETHWEWQEKNVARQRIDTHDARGQYVRQDGLRCCETNFFFCAKRN